MVRNFKICMCDEDGNILSEKLISDVPWSINSEMKFRVPKIKFREEVSEIICENINLFITPDVVSELLGEF